jgi:6-phosphofructokinase 1
MASNCVSSTDRDEAYLVGQMGLSALLNGENDKMVTLVRQMTPTYYSTTGLVELTKVANAQRLLPDEYLDENKTMVTAAFYDYALPLIGKPLPHHARIEIMRVKKP